MECWYKWSLAITEVGYLNSSDDLDCGMAIDMTTNRPILKIFNHNGSTVEEEDISRKDHGKKYIVLRNKITNKISIYGSTVTYLKKPDYLKTKTEDVATYKEEEFATVFRTKKAAQLSKSKKDTSIVSSNNIIGDISTSNLSSITSSQTNELLRYLPIGCNRFETKIENVYPLSTLLFDHEIDGMTDYAKEVISMLPLSNENEDFSEFFIKTINRLSHKTIQNICLLSYADGLIELLKKRKGDLANRREIIYPNSEEINNKLLDHFIEYTVTERCFSSKMKDKAVCHIIIIMLIINMNIIDLIWISPFIPHSSQKRLALLLKLVGATALKDDKTKFTLKNPLCALPSFHKAAKRSKKP